MSIYRLNPNILARQTAILPELLTHRKMERFYLIAGISLLVLLHYSRCCAQNDLLDRTLNEQFSNNRLNWVTINNGTTTSGIRGNAYHFSYHSTKWWNTRLKLPTAIQQAFRAEVAVLSFDLAFLSRSASSTSGTGLVFDRHGDDYNILYIGEEKGKTFAAVIPRRNRQFLKPIKDGISVTTIDKGPGRVRIEKKSEVVSVYVNDSLLITFVHKEPIRPVELYFTTGDYSIGNLELHELGEVQLVETGTEKAFDPSRFQTYALLVGVSTYQSNDFSRLNSSVNDIDSVKAFLTGPDGGNVPASNIRSLPDIKAKKELVASELKSLAKKATSNDLLILFMSGHGFAKNFLCYDGALTYAEINTILAASKAKNKLVIVDACQSGYLKPVITSSKKDNTRQKELQDTFRFKLAMATKNTHYLMSCDPEESSYDGTAKTNSLFTSALLRATRDRSLGAAGQILTINDVYKSVKKHFDHWNKENSLRKDPYVVNRDGILQYEYKRRKMTPRLEPESTINSLPFAILP